MSVDNTDLVADGAIGNIVTGNQYLLGKIFLMPRSSGLKRAIAIPKSKETMLVSLYTILITGAFMAFWILISMVLQWLMRRNLSVSMRIQKYKAFQQACAYEVTESFQAMIIIAGFCWGKICEIWQVQGRVKNSGNTLWELDTHSGGTIGGWASRHKSATLKYSLIDLFAGTFVLILVAGVVAGGVMAGIYLPETLVIGHVAPVNASNTFLFNYPQLFSTSPSTRTTRYFARSSMIDKERLKRWGAAINSGALSLDEKVNVTKVNERRRHTGEETYDIHYNYTVGWVDMGLQTSTGIEMHYTGQCTFNYDLYEGMEVRDGVLYDKYKFWDNQNSIERVHLVDLNSTCSLDADGRADEAYDERLHRNALPPNITRTRGNYYLNPFHQGMRNLFLSNDPWYFNQKNSTQDSVWNCPGNFQHFFNRIHPGRPMLQCQESVFVSYHGGQRFPLPSLDEEGSGDTASQTYNRWAQKMKAHLPDHQEIPAALTIVLWNNLRLYWPVTRGAFKFYSTLARPPFDGETQSCYNDVKASVSTAYLLARNVFRDTASYVYPRLPSDLIHDYKLGLNLLVNETTGDPVPGSGDFVISSDKVATLRLETLMAIPSVLVLAWLVILVIWFRNRHEPTGACSVCGLVSWYPKDLDDEVQITARGRGRSSFSVILNSSEDRLLSFSAGRARQSGYV